MGVVKSKIAIAALAVLLVLGAAFIANNPTGNVAASGKVKIGVIQPVTGLTSTFGQWVVQGVEIAAGEEGFEYVLQDDQCISQNGIDAYNSLKAVGIKYVIGPLCNAVSIPVASIAEEDKIVLITTGVGARGIMFAGDYSFTVLPPTLIQTKRLSDYLLSKGITKISILHINDEFGAENKETFEYAFSNKGEIVNVEKFQRTDSDFRAQLSKLKSDGSAVVIIFSYNPSNTINILKQYKELEIKKPVFGALVVQESSVINAAKDLGIEIIYPYPQVSDSYELKSFVEKYNKKFGKNESSLSVYVGAGYDAAKLLAKIIRLCGNNARCVKDELLRIKDYPGVNGPLTIDKEGNPSSVPIEMRIIKDGKFVRLEE
jgi:branched-chain amino acid transport system substrate-binding protein